MNRKSTVIFLTATALLMGCLCANVAGMVAIRSAGAYLIRGLASEPGRVNAIRSGIADYDLPAGFGQARAARVMGFSVVAYTGTDDHSHIYLFQVPSSLPLDWARLEREIGPISGNDEYTRTRVVERRACRIAGADSTLVITESINRRDQPYLAASALFRGRGGPAIVSISMPRANWDQAAVDRFVASVR
ncbi:MAG: hypothetical protein ACOYEW_13885 [Anaerolineae bacterium]|jgi:hypothetical protein